MIPLVDADVLRYEVGFAAETGWRSRCKWKEGDPPLDPCPFDYVAELMDERIEHICKTVGATCAPRLFLTGKGNFRDKIAKKAVYKGTRASKKPHHFNNLTAYLVGVYGATIVEGMEADDAICIEQTKNLNEDTSPHECPYTIICTRDKDLRQCPGYHFGWELANQPQFGPMWVDEIGDIKLVKDGKKIEGWGMKFFYSQMITGDKVDNVPGLPRKGPVDAYKTLANTSTLEEMEKAVLEAYKGVYGEDAREQMLEQAQLLYMVRELDEEGNPVMFQLTYA